MRRSLCSITLLGCNLLVGLFAAVANAADFSAEFLKEAQSRGYGEVSVDYLNALEASGKLPEDLKDTFDLQMSKALNLSAKEAFNRAERETRQAQAKERLDKFVKEHPDHPEVATAQATYGDVSFERGLIQLRLSRGTKDKEVKAKHLAEASKALEEARPRFVDAETRYHKRFDDLQAAFEAADDKLVGAKRKKAEAKVEDALYDWFESRSKLGLVEFYFSQTIEDPKDKKRVEALTKASKSFDDIFQDNRESIIGLTAHAWQGKCLDELGKLEDAADIYEEVLSNVDETQLNQETGLEGLFAQVFYFRAMLEIKKGNTKEFIATAPGWRKTFKVYKKFDGYQGISLEYAKALMAAAESAPDDEKRKMTAEFKTVLQEMTLVPSEYQGEAILLLKGGSGGGPANLADAKNVAEALAIADDAAVASNWAAAEEAYVKALAFAEASKKEAEKKQVADIKARLEQARYRQALALYSEGKHEDVLKICGKIAQNKASPIAPQAASLAVSSALMLYSASQEPEVREKALDRLSKVAEYTIKSWPDKAEADDARISMGQAKLVQGEYEGAIKVFEEVNPRSERYGTGLFLAGQTHWRLYQQVKKEDPDKAPERLQQAEKNLTPAVEALRKQIKPNEEPPRFLHDAELMLGELSVESKDYPKAVEMLAPHVAEILKAKPAVDNTVLRTFLSAVRAYMAQGDVKNASDTAIGLVDMGADEPQINKVLVGFATMMNEEWKKADGAVIEARNSGNKTQESEAQAKLDGLTDMLSKLMGKMIERKALDVKAEMFMAQTLMNINKPELAEPVYKRLIEKADAGDPAIPPQAKAGLRTPAIAIYRGQGKYDEALTQVDKLIEQYPRTLEPMMEKGRILQAWAEKDQKKFPDAVSHWTTVRQMLEGLAKKPPVYYEVIYNTALCLIMEGEQAKNEKQKIEAAKLINAMLFRTPKLDGDNTVARYKELLKRADPEGYKKREAAEKARAKELKEQSRKAAKETASK